MNQIHANRLMNVAKSLRESEHKENFTMRKYVYGEMWDIFHETNYRPSMCGTPACALGHFAARPDLQKFLIIAKRLTDKHGQAVEMADVVYKDNGAKMAWNMTKLCEYFGITSDQADDLFGADGCNKAKTTAAAARYIERFVARARKGSAGHRKGIQGH